MIDPKKQYRTRDGREVRIYAVYSGSEGNIIHGAVRNGSGWGLFAWHNTGCYFEDGKASIHDLIEVKPRIKREVWVNVYPDSISGSFHRSREDADKYRFEGCMACVKIVIDCEEGEGL